MRPTELNDLITQAEAARLRGVTREAVYDLVARGRLETIEIGGKKFVRRSEVLKLEKLPAGRPVTKTGKAKVKRKEKRA
jgi:excisionase family DNA binding protein